MILEKVLSPGLAHYSYFVASEGEAFVVDPRRDIEIYIELAQKHSVAIKGIFETHRNEDIVTGGPNLAAKTGAPLYRSAHEKLEYESADWIEGGQTFEFANLTVKALHTPGHTQGHLSYLVRRKDEDLLLFSGDTLFYGDAGRTDFYGKDRLEEMTRKLYRSLHQTYAQVSDSTILLPAHGAGSACGAAIEDRQISTLGYERRTSPLYLVRDEEEFVELHANMLLKPYYFEHIEAMNLLGPDGPLIFSGCPHAGQDSHKIDCRSQATYMGVHKKGILHINNKEFSSYLGWFVEPEENLHLVVDDLAQSKVEEMYWAARRMGYDGRIFFSGKGYQSKLQNSGVAVARTEYITVSDLEPDELILDVRKPEEFEGDGFGHIFVNRLNIPLQKLPERVNELDKNKKYLVLCGSGVRATMAYSILEGANIDAAIILGGMGAIKAQGKFAD